MVEELREMVNVPTLSKGDVVSGKVTKIEDGQVVVDVGYKFEGVIPIGELSALRVSHPTELVSIGDTVEVKVLRLNDEESRLVLSKKAVDSVRAWDRLEQLLESGEPFEVTVHDVVKGGLVADVGVRAFIPASLVELNYVQDFAAYKGQRLKVKVIECDKSENKVVLSRKAVLETDQRDEKAEILSNLEVGSIIEGTVERLTNFGAFVDIGGVDGLIHVSELSWGRVDHPSEVVKQGDVVRVKILKVDPENDRVSLSMKEAQPGPWSQVESQFRLGDLVTGTVQRLVSFGAFVEIAPGVEGLVHISRISHQRVNAASDVLEVGQEVRVKILEINVPEHRISLSIKDAEPEQRQKPTPQKHTETHTNTGIGVTIGDLFGDLFKK